MRCPECAQDRTEVKTPSYGGLSEGTARVATVLIGINVVAFVLQIMSGGGGFDVSGSVFDDGALCGNAVGQGGPCFGGGAINADGGEWWRIITSGFLHGSIVHLGLNMFLLYILGQVLEPAIGSARFLAIYLVALIAGAAGAMLMSDPWQFTIGASGAIYGIFGATIIVAWHRGAMPVVQQLGFWLVLNLVFTFTVPNISAGGHLGGLVAGAIATAFIILVERRLARHSTLTGELVVLAALGVISFVAALAIADSQSSGQNVPRLQSEGPRHELRVEQVPEQLDPVGEAGAGAGERGRGVDRVYLPRA
jgi:membrane associated rhomboid family serine protease